MMRTLPLDDILRVWSQSPSAAAAAQSLGLSRRTLYHRWHSASIEEVLQAVARIAASFETQLTGERQARLQERAAAQAQMKAVQKEGVWDRTRLAKRLAACNDALANALRELTILNLRGSGMERPLEQPQRATERLPHENQALREEIARPKSTWTERAQGPGNVPAIRRINIKRLITLEEDEAGQGDEDRLG
jgi:AcrR family transcriptional regulator